MQAYVINRFGGPEVFELATLPDPVPGPGQVRIAVKASSVNPLETKIRSGLVRTGPEFPAILNGDVAGIVDQVGAGVQGFSVGDPVIGCAGGLRGYPGALADYMLADTRLITHAPKNIPLEEAAVLPLVFMTAWNVLVDRAQLREGEFVLIHAGAGGVGHVAIQLAKSLGARVATTVSTPEKAAIVRELGADEVIHYREESVTDYVQRLTEGKGFSLVVDTIGGANLDASVAAAAVSGRVASINTRSTHDLSMVHAKNLTLHVIFRSVSMLYGIGLEAQRVILDALTQQMESGRLRPWIDEKRFSFAQIADAHRHIESGTAIGKILLTRN